MLTECAECTTLYAPDLAACPHCGSKAVKSAAPADPPAKGK